MDQRTLRVWAPPQSRLRILYRPELLRDLPRRDRGLVADGLLLGEITGRTVEVLESAPAGGDEDGLHVVGMFFYRPRGDVFLTEAEITLFARNCPDPEHVALVVAGSRAGFFVRERDGAIQSVRSYLEFDTRDKEPSKPRAASRHRWLWAGVASVILAAIPLGARVYRHDPAPAASALTLREMDGQMQILLRVKQLPADAAIEIADGPDQTLVRLYRDERSVTYVRHSGEVEVRFLAGRTTLEKARFLGPAPQAEAPPGAVAPAQGPTQ